MKTDYAGHEQLYQKRRANSEFSGWQPPSAALEDWEQTWQPLAQKLRLPLQASVLELGCGAGDIGIQFAQLGYAVSGVDIAPTAVEWAKEKAAKLGLQAQFLVEDVLELPSFEDSSFDVVVDGHCFHCIIGADRKRFLHSAYRVLKPDRFLLMSTMCNEIPEHILQQFDPVSRCSFRGDTASRYVGLSNSILQEVLLAGFQIQFAEVLPQQRSDECGSLQLIAKKPG